MAWWRRDHNGHENEAAAKARADAEARERAAKRMTPLVEQLAQHVDLSMEEFAERIAEAFRRRTT